MTAQRSKLGGLVPGPRGNPQWGEILQLPNLRSQADLNAARNSWMARQGEMTSAQSMAMSQLTNALKAQRDAKMAELLAEDAAKGGRGGGGGGRGRGGGGSAPVTLPYSTPDAPWEYPVPNTPAPTLNMHLQPYEVLGTNLPFAARKPHSVNVSKGRGFRPAPPKAKPHISRSRVVLS